MRAAHLQRLTAAAFLLGLTQACQSGTEPRRTQETDRSIAYVGAPQGSAGSALWIGAADGASRTQLAPTPTSFPACSPDGTRIVYSAHALFQLSKLLVVSADGTGAREITVPDVSLGPASWSPNGELVAARYHFRGTGRTGIGLIRPDGSAFLPLVATEERGAKSMPPSWWVDGTEILYTSGGECCDDIVAVSVQSGATRFVAANGRTARGSPDGRSVAFVQNYSVTPEIAIMRADGSDRRVLVPASRNALKFTWSRDSKRIIFAASALPLQVVTVETGGIEPLRAVWGVEDEPHMCGTP